MGKEAERFKQGQRSKTFEETWEVQSEQSEAENHSVIVSVVSSPVARPQVEEESVGGQREMEDPDGEAEEEELYTDPQEAFDDFMLTLTRDQRKMLSVLLYESFHSRQKMSMMDAARESASITGLLIIF